MWSSFCSSDTLQNLIIQCHIHWLTKTKIPRENAGEEGCHNCVLYIYGPLHTSGSDRYRICASWKPYRSGSGSSAWGASGLARSCLPKTDSVSWSNQSLSITSFHALWLSSSAPTMWSSKQTGKSLSAAQSSARCFMVFTISLLITSPILIIATLALGEQDQEIPLPKVSSSVLEKASHHVCGVWLWPYLKCRITNAVDMIFTFHDHAGPCPLWVPPGRAYRRGRHSKMHNGYLRLGPDVHNCRSRNAFQDYCRR